MGQIDDFIALDSDHPFVRRTVNGSTSGRRVGSGITSSHGSTYRPWDWQSWLDSYTSGDYLNITDRSQIINPEQILAQGNWNNSADSIAEYNKALQALRNIQAQQEAAFAEYYNSPLNQAQRDQVAGLNPDILGLSGSQAVEAGVGESQPYSGLPTSEQLAFQSEQIKQLKFQNIISALSAVTSLASAFSTLPLNIQNAINAKKAGENLDLQNAALGLANQNASLTNEALDLANQNSFGVSIAKDIAGLLSTAQQKHLESGSTDPFDLDAWFADDSNFSSLEAIYGSSPRYTSTLSHQRKAVLEHQRNAAISQKDFASNTFGLGEIISSPYYSPDQKLTMIQLKPFTIACAKAEQAEVALSTTIAHIKKQYAEGIDVSKAIDVANRQSSYQADYFSEADGKKVAAYEQFLRDVSLPGYEMEKAINQGYLDYFNTDPSGEAGWKAAYLYGSKGGASWHEAYMLRNDDVFQKLIDSEVAQAQATGDFSYLKALGEAFKNLSGGYEQFQGMPNYVSKYKYYYERIEKLYKLMGYDVEIVK